MKKWFGYTTSLVIISFLGFGAFVVYVQDRFLKTFPPDCTTWEEVRKPWPIKQTGLNFGEITSKSFRGRFFVNPENRSQICEMAYFESPDGYEDQVVWQNILDEDTEESTAWLLDVSSLFYHTEKNTIVSFRVLPFATSIDLKNFYVEILVDLMDVTTGALIYEVKVPLMFERAGEEQKCSEEGNSI